MKATPQQTAFVLLRITMGLNFFAHGLVRLPKIREFRDVIVDKFQETLLPEWLVFSWATVLPVLEFTVGILLILGLFTNRAAIVGASIIAILIFGSCMVENFQSAGGQMLYALFFYFIISSVDKNTWSLDNLISSKK